MNKRILLNGKDISSKTVLPIKWNELLDERLDEGRLSLRGYSEERVPIGATVTIKVDNTEADFIVSADTSTQMPVGSETYNHELSIIEPTKMLERIMVETLTFSNNLGRNYIGNPIKAEPVFE